MTNAEIAAVFERIALVLDLKGGENPFRIRAYERAAMTIGNLSNDLRSIYRDGGLDALEEVPGIGKDLALKIEEMIKTGKLKYLDEARKGLPSGIFEILEIEGMGPKRTKFVWEKFKVGSIPDLQKLAESGKLTELKGWGEKSVQNIMRGIIQRSKVAGRIPLTKTEPLVLELIEALKATGLVQKIEAAGSFRRKRETIGDIDILATSKDSEALMDAFTKLPQVESVTAKGPTKSTVFLTAGLDCDLRVVEKDVFGAALLYFTGSKDHNVHIRRIGIQKNLTLNEYGLYKGTAKDKGDLVAAETEEDVYKAVGLPWITPEIREDRGEVEAAQEGRLPVLIIESDIIGDLHCHSDFSDGSATMEEMADAARAKGLQYIAFADHSSPMGMVKGFGKSEEQFKDYLDRINAARKKVKGITILSATEVDILEDGLLYMPDDMLKQLDWVTASVHQHFHQSQEDVTARVIKALQNPYVCTLGHPTARMIGKREGIALDVEAALKEAKKQGKAVELNASFDRLDLNDVYVRRAKELGVMVTMGSDAHSPIGFDYRFGISQARRGWLEKHDVLNTMPWEEVRGRIQKKS